MKNFAEVERIAVAAIEKWKDEGFAASVESYDGDVLKAQRDWQGWDSGIQILPAEEAAGKRLVPRYPVEHETGDLVALIGDSEGWYQILSTDEDCVIEQAVERCLPEE